MVVIAEPLLADFHIIILDTLLLLLSFLLSPMANVSYS
jgi:hypothetical protein